LHTLAPCIHYWRKYYDLWLQLVEENETRSSELFKEVQKNEPPHP
jgi:hypothetical protein